jgi:myo-inositol catabolism protein IolS
MSTLETMRLGRNGPSISRLGLGCWAVGGHGWGKVRDEDSVSAIRCAWENGVTFFDTADVYGLGKSETLLAEVLGPNLREAVVASKGGVRWDESGKVWTDNTPAYLRSAVENSLRRLKLDCIPLYYIHKTDGKTPVAESVAALERMREEGKIGAVGVSNFSADQVLQAAQVARIAAVQVRLNVFDREGAGGLLELCREHGMTLVAWGALADGILTGKFTKETEFSGDDHRSRMSEFAGDNFMKLEKCLEGLNGLAVKRRRKIGQLALRWVLDLEPFSCSLFGAKTDMQVRENLGADGWSLTQQERTAIDSIVAEYRR